MSKKMERKHLYRSLIAVGAVIACLLPIIGLNPTYVQWLTMVGINTILGLSITMLLGFTGEISLGSAGFFAIGAYGSALMVLKLHFPIWISIPLAMALCALVGLLLSFPAGRVREFYLAILTFGFGMIIQVFFKEWKLSGGVSGLSGIPSPTMSNLIVFGQNLSLTSYYLSVLAIMLIVYWVLNNLLKSYVGRSLVSVATSEIAAASLGINPGRVRQLAYAISGSLAGLGGALYAHLVGYIGYEAFGLMASVNMLVTAILGGLNVLIGALFGAIVLTIAPQVFQVLQDWQLLFFGLLLFVVAVVFPGGLASIFRICTSYVRTVPSDHLPEEKVVLAFGNETSAVEKNTSDDILILENVSKSFGGVMALNGISMKIARGTIHGLIGPNGSGKSTLVNVVSGVYKLDRGSVIFQGENLSNLPAYKFARKGIVRTFQNPQIFKGMTVEENAVAGAYQRFKRTIIKCMLNVPSARKEEARILAETKYLLQRAGLQNISKNVASELPYGHQRLIEVIRAANAKPKLLILDEPAAGLSEAELVHLGSIIRLLRDEGVTILLIEHHIEFLMGLVDSITVLEYGGKIFDGLPKACIQDPRVIEAYLGGQHYAQAQCS